MELDTVTLAMPGSAVPAEQLATAELPPLPAMVADALDSRCDYARGTSVSAQASTQKGEHSPRPPPQPPPGPWPRQQDAHRGSPHAKGTEAAAAAGQTGGQCGPAAEIQPAAGDGASGTAKPQEGAAEAQAQRGRWQDRLKQRIAGVIHLDDQQQGEAGAASRPAGVVPVRLPDRQGAAASAAEAEAIPIASEAAQAPADGEQQQQRDQQQEQQHEQQLHDEQLPGGISGHAANVAAELSAARAAGSRPSASALQGLARELPSTKPLAEPRRPNLVQLSAGGRRPISPPPPVAAATLKPGQTPFGLPHVQQRPLNGSGRSASCAQPPLLACRSDIEACFTQDRAISCLFFEGL